MQPQVHWDSAGRQVNMIYHASPAKGAEVMFALISPTSDLYGAGDY